MTPDIWDEISLRLRRGEAVAIASIATHEGSAPRNAGAKLLAGKEGLSAGTLGGGRGEAMALEAAELAIRDGKPRLLEIDMSGEAEAGADLVCGGKVRVFIQKIPAEWDGIFEELCERKRLGLDSLLVTPLSGRSPMLVDPAKVSGNACPWGAQVQPGGAGIFEVEGHGECLVEMITAPVRLVLAGGGHVSLAVARIANLAGFDVTVLDDRVEFANGERFSFVSPARIHVVPAYENCLHEETLGFPITGLCCIAILTRGHAFDGEVLSQALKTNAGYVGMIGSTRKRDAVYAAMRKEGFGDRELQRVHCPIGLPLGGKSPTDIAVSIVAELVSIRAKEFSRS